MEVRRGYKQTEAGVIPEDWKVINLSQASKGPMQNGLFSKPSRKGFGVKLINVGDLYIHTPIDPGALELFGATDKEIEIFRVESGDLFFTRSSIVPSGIAHCNIYHSPEQDPAVFDSHIIRLKPDTQKIYPLYLFRFCLTSIARRYLVSHSKTATMTTIDQGVLSKCPVLLPPTKAEQEAIADALSDADALIESLERLLVKKRQVKQGAMQELLTGKKRLPGFEVKPGYKQTETGLIPEDWTLDYVEDLAHITTGSRNTQDRVSDGQYPFFVRSQTVERINSYSFDGEAVLTAGDGVGTGKVFHYINDKFDIHQRVYKISGFDDRISGYFFYLYFRSRFYNRIMQMTAKSSVDSVRREMIARMLIPLPPTKVEQEAIATILSDMGAEITALEAKLAKARQIKQGMMQELLTGRIRLI